MMPLSDTGPHSTLSVTHGSPDPETAGSPRPEMQDEKPALQRSLSKAWIAFWWLEAATLCFGIVSLVAVIILLACFDKKTPPSTITLGTYIAIFATIIQECFALVVGASIAQEKWNHFRRGPRPVYDFYNMDEASKGALGSVRYLLRSPSNVYVAVGAVIFILIQAIGPFLQQVQDQQPVPGPLTQIATTDISLPVLQYFKTTDGTSATNVTIGVEPQIDATLRYAVYNGLYASNTTDLDVTTYVSNRNANATWDDVTTLAVCSQCSDITQNLTVTRLDPFQGADRTIRPNHWNVSLPNGFYLNTISGPVHTDDPEEVQILDGYWQDFSMTALPPITERIVYENDTTALTVLSMIYMPPNATDSTAAKAQQCVLSVCLQQRNASILNSRFSDNMTRSTINVTYPEADVLNSYWRSPWSWAQESISYRHDAESTFIWQEGTEADFNLSYSDRDYTAEGFINLPLAIFLADNLAGVHTVQVISHFGSNGDYLGPQLKTYNSTDIIQLFRDAYGPNQPVQFSPGDVLSNVARSLTRGMRDRNGSISILPTLATEQVLVIRVDWRWISLPVVVTLLVVVHFAHGSLTSEVRRGVWKANVLASIVFLLPERDYVQLQHAEDTAELVRRSKSVEVSLADDSTFSRQRQR